ncbi:heavy-metal-associated domain-containing protein [Alicyclobacillus acidiphilus]|jgi:copper chaperone CopZ|uniref:heavy-metal-associated domain-containing protein n=1 Tax=Alicyclobacillus acidiphilus TaxID=182455 RepID=UPI0008368011|nr:heavy-metal-associated domain-containing protein [Alicyclobacillus acidiphilus]
MAISTITLEDVTCALCANRVSVALHAVEGIRNFDVDLAEQTAVITFDDDEISGARIRDVIDDNNCDVH